ncbi:DUF3089 domain-containing protein [Pseudonocardia sp.]|uniref:DUF3089 domain-containing protein n=1 Tax=Pseudonocardia sp. TaxID=60912 RepID=UPI00260AD104|nr:DUF3089 domain-containing protein [Pseudonocardia sp.]
MSSRTEARSPRRVAAAVVTGLALVAAAAALAPAAVAQPAAPASGGTVGLPAPHRPTSTAEPLARPLAEPVWLCRPGLPDNPCNQDVDGSPQDARPPFRVAYPRSGGRTTLDTATVPRNGPVTVEPFAPPDEPSVDCFYVYPTVDLLPNPPLRIGSRPPRPTDTEMAVLLAQVGPMLNQCRMFVPTYRQTTLLQLAGAGLAGREPDFTLGRADVDQAFAEYWSRYNLDRRTGERRGVVLLGHSQGSSALAELLAREFDGTPAQAQLVSAVLLGTDIIVPADGPGDGAGDDTVTTFREVPACERASAAAPIPVGCVIGQVSYNVPEGRTPPEDSVFGRSDAAHRVLCSNPAALLAGTDPDDPAAAEARLPSRRLLEGGVLNPGGHLGLLSARFVQDVPAGYARLPGLVTGQCRSEVSGAGRVSWFEVDGPPGIIGEPDRSRAGLHVQDYSLVLGDLAALIDAQIEAWSSR